jgi:hypothetical protein
LKNCSIPIPAKSFSSFFLASSTEVAIKLIVQSRGHYFQHHLSPPKRTFRASRVRFFCFGVPSCAMYA